MVYKARVRSDGRVRANPVAGLGITGVPGPEGTELAMHINGVPRVICEKINDSLGYNTSLSLDAGALAYTSPFSGTYTRAGDFVAPVADASLHNKPSQCVYLGNMSKNVFYQVLIVR